MAATAIPTATDGARASDEALGERLIAAGRLERAGLQRALRMCEASHERLHVMLVKLGLVPEREVAAALVLALAGAATGGKLSATTRIEFGPYLALAIWVVWLYGPLVPT